MTANKNPLPPVARRAGEERSELLALMLRAAACPAVPQGTCHRPPKAPSAGPEIPPSRWPHHRQQPIGSRTQGALVLDLLEAEPVDLLQVEVSHA